MISCISCENVHEFGMAFHSQFRLRYGGFVERQQYDVSVYDGAWFDRYDCSRRAVISSTTRTRGGRSASAGLPRPSSPACSEICGHTLSMTNRSSNHQWFGEGTRYA